MPDFKHALQVISDDTFNTDAQFVEILFRTNRALMIKQNSEVSKPASRNIRNSHARLYGFTAWALTFARENNLVDKDSFYEPKDDAVRAEFERFLQRTLRVPVGFNGPMGQIDWDRFE